MEENRVDVYKKWVEDRFPGKGLRPVSNGFKRERLWLRFGKHKDQDPWVILEKDPGYFSWALRNVAAKMPPMLIDFIEVFSKDIEQKVREKEERMNKLLGRLDG